MEENKVQKGFEKQVKEKDLHNILQDHDIFTNSETANVIKVLPERETLNET